MRRYLLQTSLVLHALLLLSSAWSYERITPGQRVRLKPQLVFENAWSASLLSERQLQQLLLRLPPGEGKHFFLVSITKPGHVHSSALLLPADGSISVNLPPRSMLIRVISRIDAEEKKYFISGTRNDSDSWKVFTGLSSSDLSSLSPAGNTAGRDQSLAESGSKRKQGINP